MRLQIEENFLETLKMMQKQCKMLLIAQDACCYQNMLLFDKYFIATGWR